MRTFSFIITLLLTLAWGYTSWYWYTCNIKGFCEGQNPIITQIPQREDLSEDDFIASWSASNAQKLSASDVLLESQKRQTQSWSSVPVPDSQTGTTQDISSSGASLETAEENLIKNSAEDDTQNPTICTGNFVGPVALWAQNDTAQVELLEKFLFSQGNTLTIDGVYDSNDVAAVKAFQLEHKQEILDPWGIAAPTGYVYTTTIKKMKEIACE